MALFRTRLTLALAAGAAMLSLAALQPASAQPYGPPPGWAGPHYYAHGRHYHHRAWAWDHGHHHRYYRYY